MAVIYEKKKQWKNLPSFLMFAEDKSSDTFQFQAEIPNPESQDELWQYFDLEHVETMTDVN